MRCRPIIDAGPALNFLSINKERLLIETLGKLSAPVTVQNEVFRKSRQDDRFRAAEGIWRKMEPNWIEILSDDVTRDLAIVVSRISGLPMQDRLRSLNDLGETMVVAHAVVAAETGEEVSVLIDDGLGAQIATAEIRRLQRLRAGGRSVGKILLINTLAVLKRAAGTPLLPDRATMRETYTRLRGLDDGLPPLKNTDLLSARVWPNADAQ